MGPTAGADGRAAADSCLRRAARAQVDTAALHETGSSWPAPRPAGHCSVGREAAARRRASVATAMRGGCCVTVGLSGAPPRISGVGPNFLTCDRDQVLLLPPSLREWLPEGHLAWFVIDAVEQMDLTAFYGAYRLDGQGRAAHEPSMMVALLLYSYAVGERSSRRIERRCVEDVATRVICANRAPDHTTIARFRQRHEDALAELFGEVLWLCADAGLVRVGVVAVDGTKVQATPRHRASRDYEQIAREILEHADAVDAEEDERFGDARGDELPEQFSTPEGRQRWLRDARRRLDDKRAREARPIPGPRPKRLKEAKRRLEEDH